MPKSKPAAKTSATSSRRMPDADTADAVRLLTADHLEVKGLFDAYKKLVSAGAEAGERKTVADRICAMLTVHATIEEEIFYPAAREAIEERNLLDEAQIEHASAKELIGQIEEMEEDDDLFDAKVTVLGEYIDHHVKEEEGELFPKCRKAEMDLAELGAELAERKAALISELGIEAEA